MKRLRLRDTADECVILLDVNVDCVMADRETNVWKWNDALRLFGRLRETLAHSFHNNFPIFGRIGQADIFR